MKINLSKRIMLMFFTFFVMVSLVPTSVFAAEGDTNITEVNINGVSDELWSYQDVAFATIDESSNYTIEKQEWYSSETDKITPTSESLKPTVGEEYTFNITLKAKDGYVFPTKSKTNVFYGGVFKVNGNECDNPSITVTSDKTILATLFTSTKVKGVTDNPNVKFDTTVCQHYTDCQVTDDINLKKCSDYIIDFTKEDDLSMALRSMADLEKTKYYKFANNDNNSLVETENAAEALIKIVGNKSKNKATMSLLSDINKNISYSLSFMRTKYTGSKLTYTGTDRDEQTGKTIIHEIRDEYYTRYHFNCKLNLIAYSSTSDSDANINYQIIEGENSSWTKGTDEKLTFRANGDFSKFEGIKIDDELVSSENYIAISGSTIVTLKDEYLKALPEGEHKITFIYTNGECSTNFEIKKIEEEIYKNSDNPQTGDNSNMLLWNFLFLASIVGMLGITIFNKRNEYMI